MVGPYLKLDVIPSLKPFLAMH